MTFDDLKFEPHANWNGVQAVAFFPNGYVASVIRADHSYGGPQGLYELAKATAPAISRSTGEG